MKPFNWTCNFCGIPQTVVHDRISYGNHMAHVGDSKHGKHHIVRTATICCANPDCLETTLNLGFFANKNSFNSRIYDDSSDVTIEETQIRPTSKAKMQPSYITNALVEDYYEACKILHLSPKSAATLTRRCLQGMIRDFCSISKGTLFKEIEALKAANETGNAPKGVTDETVEAIDHVRQVGNIGAHMEKNINHIVEIAPGEAEALIGLVELLFEEWYVARHKREQKLAKIKSIAIQKAEDKKPKTHKED